MFRLVLFALLFAQGAEARPRYDDHLLPEDSVFTDIDFRLSAFDGPYGSDFQHYMHYEENVARVLRDAFRFEIVGRVVAYPSFEPEYAVALEFKEEKYRILFFEPSVQLRHFDELEIMNEKINEKPDSDFRKEELASYLEYLEAENINLPETREEVEVSQCGISISNELGDKLYSLWSEMLFRTRYPDLPPAGVKSEPVMINSGIDGTRYHFSFEYPGFTLAGQIWQPRAESLTGKFVHVSSMMKDACRSEGVAKILAELESHVDRLNAELAETDN
ncbi:hypothetical protein [Hyphococcus sp.]|jgi:hypothetical protein|uniref:hypothetical protein n=1 Tax=Hyphococcus sp. TaxID=2038636 RepID=UPI003D0CD247